MKQWIIMVITVFLAVTAYAQEAEETNAGMEINTETEINNDGFRQQTLLGNGSTSYGIYGGFIVQGSYIDGLPQLVTGAEGGMIINHSIVIGLTGKGLCTGRNFPEKSGGTNVNMELGWGGVTFGYIFWPEELIHPYIKATIGAGGIGYGTGSHDRDALRGNAFFAGDVEAGAEINVVKWMRLEPYIGYHYVNGNVDMLGMNDVKLSGLNFGVKALFGLF